MMKIVILSDAEAKAFKTGVKSFPLDAIKELLKYYLDHDNSYDKSWELMMRHFREKTTKV